ncbi:uncharacterized protein [Dermacentor albipictus]|uniref:uncharacterized protein n=1 Tax=Dermacentor albipictus TaxID=60249 RepID=UPI0038FCAA54
MYMKQGRTENGHPFSPRESAGRARAHRHAARLLAPPTPGPDHVRGPRRARLSRRCRVRGAQLGRLLPWKWTPVHPNDPHTSPRSGPKSGPRFRVAAALVRWYSTAADEEEETKGRKDREVSQSFSALGLVIALNVVLPDFLEGCLSAAGRCVLWPPAGVYPLTPHARGPVGGAWRSAASTAALSLRPRALARNLPRGANGISRSQKASSATPCAGRDLGAPRPSAERPLAFRLRLTALQWLVTSGTRGTRHHLTEP